MSTAEDGGPGGDDVDRGRWSGLRVEGSEYTDGLWWYGYGSPQWFIDG